MNLPHPSLEELERALVDIRESPRDLGLVKMIVRRPRTNEREVLKEAELSAELGLVGDKWKAPASNDRSCQITVMNSRAISAIAGAEESWAPAGDQLFVDLDLSVENLPAGTRLEIGAAVLEISEFPHAGCKKFAARYGPEAVEFVNSPAGKKLRLRGLNARVIRSGVVRVGDRAKKSVAA